MSKLPVARKDEDTGPADGAEKQRAIAIGRAVLTALGRPAEFLRVTVRQVTADSFRVNVVTGPDPSSSRIAHSFFVTADEVGVVTGSDPAIARRY